MKTKYQLLGLSIFFAVLFAACSASSLSLTPTAQPTEFTQAVIVTPTATPPTAAPTETATPLTPTVEGWHTPSETSNLGEGRNWQILIDYEIKQIGGFNQDGTGLTWFDLPPIHETYGHAAFGHYWAYIAEYEIQIDFLVQELILVEFPAGEIVTRLLLHPDDINLSDDEFPSYYIKYHIGDLSWSPGGQYIAVSGSSTGNSTDIFLYSIFEDTWVQLTNESKFLYSPRWVSDDLDWLQFKEQRIHEEPEIDMGLGENSKIWEINIHTQESHYLDQITVYAPADWGDSSEYWEEVIGGTPDIQFLAYDQFDSDVPGVYVQTVEDTEPRLIYEIEDAGLGRVIWNKEMQRYYYTDYFDNYFIISETGELEHVFIHYQQNGQYIAVIDPEFRIQIYEINPKGGLSLIWDFTKWGRYYDAVPTKSYGNFIVYGNFDVFYLDTSKGTLEVLIPNTTEIAIGESLWLPQK